MASSFLHNFVMNALKSAIGSMPDFWVLNNALGWMEKGVLTAVLQPVSWNVLRFVKAHE